MITITIAFSLSPFFSMGEELGTGTKCSVSENAVRWFARFYSLISFSHWLK